ncbi:hypothetical protein GCM10023212_24730 [Luteolibacter yonseiensis]
MKAQRKSGIPDRADSFGDVTVALDARLRRTDPEFLRRSEHSSRRFAAKEPGEQEEEPEPSPP